MPPGVSAEDRQRVAEWVTSCRSGAQKAGKTPLQIFDDAVHDMRHAGFRLPDRIVSRVRAELARVLA